MTVYNLQINGTAHRVDVDPAMPMLWVLRDVLDLKGSKFGCGLGQCGACTIHLNGRAVRGCLTPVSTVGTQAVTTIEGLASDPVGARVQKAWLDVDVVQCGYCQAGQIMNATDLLKTTPKPTDAEIDAKMNGNLCRCATYVRIRQAIKTAAGMPTADTRAA
jgi:isoquinoline 1-oxidoreductase alpha subunit